MIAGSTIGEPPLHNTVGMLMNLKNKIISLLFTFKLGVVYISPLTGEHFPAFVHVYRCDTLHMAQKFLSRLRSYLLIENHRLRIVKLEEQLLERNLLNIDYFNARKSRKTDTSTSPSSKHSNNRQENKSDPIKSITEEFQKKLDSNEPILFPPKDYDTVHAAHGNIQRAQGWKSTEVTKKNIYTFSTNTLILKVILPSLINQ
jgi:G3E family GTPase